MTPNSQLACKRYADQNERDYQEFVTATDPECWKRSRASSNPIRLAAADRRDMARRRQDRREMTRVRN